MNASQSAALVVASLFQCNGLPSRMEQLPPLWQQNVIGCRVLALLQQMYNFSMTYRIVNPHRNLTDTDIRLSLYPQLGSGVDVYARPMTLRPAIMDVADPVHHIYHRRFGFILIRPDFGLFRSMYSEPFTEQVWHALLLMLLLSACVFYMSKRWERQLCSTREECSLSMELLLAISAWCQQSPPEFSKLISRRTAIFFTSLFSFAIYSFYTSNLLSHLVSDRDGALGLDALADSEFECVLLESQKSIIEDVVGLASPFNRYLINKKFSMVRTVSTMEGLQAVRGAKAALLSDYVTVYPAMKETFTEEELCQVFEVDMSNNVQSYLFTRRGFPMLEQFKVGTLRLLEAGLLQRTVSHVDEPPPACLSSSSISIELKHVTLPLCILAGTCAAAALLMLAEKLTFYRKPWPYIE